MLRSSLASRNADVRKLQQLAEQDRNRLQMLMATNQPLIAQELPTELSAPRNKPFAFADYNGNAGYTRAAFNSLTTLHAGMPARFSESALYTQERDQQVSVRMRSIPSGLDQSQARLRLFSKPSCQIQLWR